MSKDPALIPALFLDRDGVIIENRSDYIKNKDEIVPIEIELEDGSSEMHSQDEGIRMDATLGALAGLQPLQDPLSFDGVEILLERTNGFRCPADTTT